MGKEIFKLDMLWDTHRIDIHPGSMGLVYLPTFTIKINHSWIGKYTFRPMDGMGNELTNCKFYIVFWGGLVRLELVGKYTIHGSYGHGFTQKYRSTRRRG